MYVLLSQGIVLLAYASLLEIGFDLGLFSLNVRRTLRLLWM